MISVYDKTLSEKEKSDLHKKLKDQYLYIASHKKAD